MDFSEEALVTLIGDIATQQRHAFMSGFACSMFLSLCFATGFIGFKVLTDQPRQEIVAPTVQPA
jgi:hypothetical protein